MAGTPGLTVPEWRVLYPPDGRVPREALCRHVLATGQTGSGKSASCTLPVVAAMAKAPRERVGAALIIDPKRELARTLRALAPARVHEVRADQMALNVMAGPRLSLDDDLAAGRWGWFSTLYDPRWGRPGGFLARSSSRFTVLGGHEQS